MVVVERNECLNVICALRILATFQNSHRCFVPRRETRIAITVSAGRAAGVCFSITDDKVPLFLSRFSLRSNQQAIITSFACAIFDPSALSLGLLPEGRHKCP